MNNEFEVIVINDGSDDLMEEEIKKQNYSKDIRYYYHERGANSGASFARNKGIEKANGDILIFMDCDEIAKPDFVFSHYIFFQNIQDEILQVGFRNNIVPYAEVKLENIDNVLTTADVREKVFEKFSYNFGSLIGAWGLVFSCNISVHRKTVEKYGGFDENFKGWGLEDIEFGYRLNKNGVKIVFNPNIYLYHQYHNFNLEGFKEGFGKNLEYFISKYDGDLHALQLSIFRDFYDQEKCLPLIEAEVQKGFDSTEAMNNVWISFFDKFENVLRTLDGIMEKKQVTLICPTIEKVENMLKEYEECFLTIVCNKSDVGLIGWVQTCYLSNKIRLFVI